MDFRFTAEDEAFRSEVRSFIQSRLPKDFYSAAMFEGEEWLLNMADENDRLIQSDPNKRWLTMAWPKEYGGKDATYWQQAIWNWEVGYWRFPVGGAGLAGPTLMVHGTDEQKKYWLPRIANMQDRWCQLFTEPGAGSDLASLQTRATEDGDTYVVNGQKIFTSGGHRADFGWAGFRTDPTAPKHRGISVFIVPMHAPGVTVRPLINMAGIHAQNEVFFDEARIPRENLVGEKNRGWYIMATTLDIERSGSRNFALAARLLEELVGWANETSFDSQVVAKQPRVRNKLAQTAIESEVGKWLSWRIVYMQSQKQLPNREASESKIFGTELLQRVANTGMQVLGLHGQARHGSKYETLRGRFEHMYKETIFLTIGAGSSEIQRNIIAQRGLGLPR